MNNRRNPRRGVLLLVVLGILAMFGVVAITLVVIARHAKDTAEINQRMDQQTYSPAEDLNQAFLQVARGSDEPNSAIGPHSLAEDMYGNNSAVGTVIIQPPPAGAGDPPQSPRSIGGGQIIEFITSLPATSAHRYVGCVITMLDGPAAGRSTRIVGYVSGTAPAGNRLQVVAFDDVPSGMALGVQNTVVGFNYAATGGSDYIINGAAFSGTGFGYHDQGAGDTVLLDVMDGAYPRALLPNPATTTADLAAPGGANEDYDAPDYQNMMLAMVIPPIDTDGNGTPDTPARVVAPSLHRPALINYWINQAGGGTWVGVPADLQQRIMLRPQNLSFTSATNPGFNPVTGPWDVDCDGDGITDSIWVDLGMSTRTTPDGRQYRPLFAILCVDLDGRLNLNANGSMTQCIASYYDMVSPSPQAFAGDPAPATPTAVYLPRGQGFGPAEINLMPLFDNDPATWPPDADDRTRLLTLMVGGSGTDGRYGEVLSAIASRWPGRAASGTYAYNDPLSANQLFNFFWDPTTPLDTGSAAAFNYFNSVTSPGTIRGAFGSPVDPLGSMALAIDLRGQPVYRVLDIDGTAGNTSGDWAMPAVNDPYELNLSRSGPRGLANNASDNPFTVAELERLLRPYDVDASMLPPRLRNLVPILAAGASATSRDRRFEVTTDSWDPPTANVAMIQDLRDQLPGDIAYHLSDLLDAANRAAGGSGLSAAAMAGLLPVDVLAGLRLDLNRPFGNGRDNNANGVVDDPAEAPLETLPQLDSTSAAIAGIPFDADNNGIVNGADQYARQLYARYLYVLLMALTDDGWYPPTADTSAPFDQAAARARGLAQFAVNVVDFRDRDSIMTRFAYDPTPFSASGWSATASVWGCERPELLISETLAFHNRRAQDMASPDGTYDTNGDGVIDPGEDDDFDQQYKPEGSFYVELFNPWTGDEPPPGEFYYDGAWQNGVVLDQTTPGAAAQPVWRLAVVTAADAAAEPDPDLQTVERSVYFVDPTPLGVIPDGERYWTTTAISPVPHNGYAVIGPGDAAGTTNVSQRAIGPATPPRRIVIDPSIAGDHQVEVRHNTAYTTGDPGDNELPPVAEIRPAVGVLIDTSTVDPTTNPFRAMNVSEPVGGYALGGWIPATGLYTPALDAPLDTGVLAIEGTIMAHCKVHLQRLANPLLPYDATNNPYRTVDTMPVDLTVYNGQEDETLPDGPITAGTVVFRSRERGENTTLTPAGSNKLWPQEPDAPTGTSATPAESPAAHVFNRILQHSLGYLNTAYQPWRTAPAAYQGDPDGAAFPWFAWNNRPFVSPAELMQVPALSASELLRYYNVATAGSEVYSPTDFTEVPYPHLLNFTRITPFATATPPNPPGHFYRLFEYVQVPSPFVDTAIQGNPAEFAAGAADAGLHGFHAPFNRISRYRDPGRININTIFSPDVWRGVLDYFPGGGLTTFGGQLANFEDQLVVSRRGYDVAQPGVDPAAEMAWMNIAYPTMFANPFRSFAGNQLVPTAGMGTAIGEGVNATILRASPTDATQPLLGYSNTTDSYVNTDRNPYFRHEAIQKLGNLVTTRSNVYAVWITEGYFEVNLATGALGAELGTDTGDIKRHRAFYIFDRSIPVGFQRGEDLNVERAILLSRFIE